MLRLLTVHYYNLFTLTATFFLTNLEFSQSIEICEKFLAFPPKHNANGEYLNHIYVNVFEQLLEDKTTEEIENVF
jgi:hypothetical protein